MRGKSGWRVEKEKSKMESWQMAVGAGELRRLEVGGGSLRTGNLGVRPREREQTEAKEGIVTSWPSKGGREVPLNDPVEKNSWKCLRLV